MSSDGETTGVVPLVLMSCALVTSIVMGGVNWHNQPSDAFPTAGTDAGALANATQSKWCSNGPNGSQWCLVPNGTQPVSMEVRHRAYATAPEHPYLRWQRPLDNSSIPRMQGYHAGTPLQPWIYHNFTHLPEVDTTIWYVVPGISPLQYPCAMLAGITQLNPEQLIVVYNAHFAVNASRTTWYVKYGGNVPFDTVVRLAFASHLICSATPDTYMIIDSVDHVPHWDD